MDRNGAGVVLYIAAGSETCGAVRHYALQPLVPSFLSRTCDKENYNVKHPTYAARRLEFGNVN